MVSRRRIASRAAAVAALLAAGAVACATTTPGAARYRFFAPLDAEGEPWLEKVADWQQRERRDRPQESLADAQAVREAGIRSGLLTVKMGRWLRQERLETARRISAWAQVESPRHYRFDERTDWVNDPWPTTAELLERNGDDCDGLDLIAYKLLRATGFPEEELYRAIVVRALDGGHHMVTLWFDEGPDDPWVIDAIGAVSKEVRRFSQLPGWTPTKIFNEARQFSPAPIGGPRDLAHRAAARNAP